VVTTTAPARGSRESAVPPTAAADAAGGRAEAAPDAAAENATPGPASRPSRPPNETGYSLLAPPDYDNIVGGVPPSPYASLILLAGLICIVVSTVATAAGADMTQWWVLGAALVVVAVFLAGFVSRS
jgi:hypothetical protein